MLRPARRVLLPIFLAVLHACKGTTPEPTTADAREAIRLPAEAQDAVRAEMNTMLASLNSILAALPRQDTAAIRQAAAASGVATAADPTLEKLLPGQFLTWGLETHRGFDALAASVGGGVALDTALIQLATLTQTCVTCHATYRLAPP